MRQQISLKQIDKPRKNSIKEEIRWIFDSLDLISGRDTEDTSFQIFYEFLKRLEKENGNTVSSQSIADELGIDTSKVNHHIRSLMNSGLIFREKRRIRLRGGSLSAALEAIRKDMDRMFEDLIEVSEEIDRIMKFI